MFEVPFSLQSAQGKCAQVVSQNGGVAQDEIRWDLRRQEPGKIVEVAWDVWGWRWVK